MIDPIKAEQIIYRRWFKVSTYGEAKNFPTIEEAFEHAKKYLNKTTPITIIVEDKEDF